MTEPKARIRSVINPNVLEMDAYPVQDASGLIKLDAMENPYSFPKALQDAWLDALRDCDLNRYPDPAAKNLAETVRRVFKVPDSCGLIFGNGSDELIQMIVMAVAIPGACVLIPEPSFVMYRQIAQSLGLETVGVPLLPESFALDRDEMIAAIRRCRPSVVFLPYPNNPTGNLFRESDIESILSYAPGIVVIDEAYSPFADATFMDRLCTYPNLLVMRTVSKLGLAGLRLGYLVGHPSWLDQFNKIRLPYNINVLTQMSAGFALSHYAVYAQQSREICVQRELMWQALDELEGITAFPSRTNFILFRVRMKDARSVYQELKRAGILIKDLSAAHELVHGCLRVTIGTAEENNRFLHELARILGS